MKNLLFLIILGGLAYWGINKALDEPMEEAEEYVEEVTTSQAKAEARKDEAGLRVVQGAVRSFEASEGRLPKSLAELKSKGYVDRIPGGLEYDTSSGEVSWKD